MEIINERLEEVRGKPIMSGSHSDQSAMCVMEAVAYVAGEPWSDSPQCACIRDSIDRGETPYASHKMLTDALDDLSPEERKIGIQAGLDMRAHLVEKCGAVVAYYTDLGWSSGMKAAAQTPVPDTRDRLIRDDLWNFVLSIVKERNSNFRDRFFWEIARDKVNEAVSTKDGLLAAREVFLNEVKS